MSTWFEDVFGGGGGSQDFGYPTTAGAGDGGKASVITDFLGALTGAYTAVTGAGRKGGPAPAPVAVTQPQANWLPWAVGAGLVALVLVLFLKK